MIGLLSQWCLSGWCRRRCLMIVGAVMLGSSAFERLHSTQVPMVLDVSTGNICHPPHGTIVFGIGHSWGLCNSHGAFCRMGEEDLGDDDESYFLAGRSLSGPILLVDNGRYQLSAFTAWLSGVSQCAGLSFLPIMAFGTGFMAVHCTFWGRRSVPLCGAWRYDSTRIDPRTDRF